MQFNPKAKGEKAEAACLYYLTDIGVPVSVPWGNNQRYDLVIEFDGKLLKAQCKVGIYKNGVVSFSTASKSGGKGKRKNYVGQIDCFLIFCKELKRLYMIPISLADKSAMSLRVDPPKKFSPKIKFNWAKDFEIMAGE